jgi:DnaJ domain
MECGKGCGVERSSSVEQETRTARPVAPTPREWERGAGHDSLGAYLEHALGEEFEPDAEFFVESWTHGFAAAAENFRHRQPASFEPSKPAFWGLGSFRPVFSIEDHQSLFEAMLRDPNSSDRAVSSRNPFHEWSLPFLQEGTTEAGHASAPPEPPGAGTGKNQPLAVDAARALLGLGAGSSRTEIKMAYRHMARLNHPDRIASALPADKAAATERMIRINEAYRLLSALG